jgi:hypothetical protein
MKDMNWPIAREIPSILLRFNEDLIPYIRSILRTNDGEWKYWILNCLIRNLPKHVIIELRPELERVKNDPTYDEINVELNEEVEELLQRLL